MSFFTIFFNCKRSRSEFYYFPFAQVTTLARSASVYNYDKFARFAWNPWNYHHVHRLIRIRIVICNLTFSKVMNMTVTPLNNVVTSFFFYLFIFSSPSNWLHVSFSAISISSSTAFLLWETLNILTLFFWQSFNGALFW